MAQQRYRCIVCKNASWQQLPVKKIVPCPWHKCQDGLLAPDGPIIAQNSHQSGDTYGVCMALLLEPRSTLLFATSPDDTGCADKVLFYAGMGIAQHRLKLLMLIKDKQHWVKEQNKWQKVANVSTIHTYIVGEKSGEPKILPNQIYKKIVNSDVYIRLAKKRKEEPQVILDTCKHYAAALLPFIDDKVRAPVCEIGASTRIVADIVKGPGGLKKTLDATWKQMTVSLSKANSKYPDTATDEIILALNKLPLKPKGVILLWVRSLSNSEIGQLEESFKTSAKRFGSHRKKNHNIDEYFWALDAGKRNPHHLMTPQLFETISFVASRINYAVIPIGDTVELDRYGCLGKNVQTNYITKNESPLNLIGFWRKWEKWFGGDERRLRQTFLCWKLFQRLCAKDLPMVQIGLRSGEMEKAAYLGVPTIYLEEKASDSGARMLPVTVGGWFAKNNEPSTQSTTWWRSANAFAVGKKDSLSEINKSIMDKKKIIKKLMEQKHLSVNFHRSNLQSLEKSRTENTEKVIKLREDRRIIGEKQLDKFLFSVTDHSSLADPTGPGVALDGGYPMFYRLTITHDVGMYAAKSISEVENVKAWLKEKFLYGQKSNCSDNTLRGTLTEFEIDMLYNILLNISTNFAEYKKQFLPL